MAVSLANLGWANLYQGNADRASALARQSLRLCCQLGEREMMAECLELLSSAELHVENAHHAVLLSGASETLGEALHCHQPALQHTTTTRAATIASLRQRFAVEEFTTLWQRGRAMPYETIVRLALRCDRVPHPHG